MVHFFFFNDTATTEIYTLSLHDALPIFTQGKIPYVLAHRATWSQGWARAEEAHSFEEAVQDLPRAAWQRIRSEEHTSELQSRQYLVCRLLLEKKKMIKCRESSHNSSSFK